MGSAIRNDIGNGLKEVANYSYSLDQIYDEIGNVWNSIVYKMSLEGRSSDLINFSMIRENLPLEYGAFPYGTENNIAVLHTRIPRLAMTVDNTSLTYFGPPDMSFVFKAYFNPADLKTHQYSRIIKNRPYIFVDPSQTSDNLQSVYIFNMSAESMKKVSVRGVFADPIELLRADGVFSEDEEFPAPPGIQQQIIDTIVAKYVKYYRQMNGGYQPNTQTDQK